MCGEVDEALRWDFHVLQGRCKEQEPQDMHREEKRRDHSCFALLIVPFPAGWFPCCKWSVLVAFWPPIATQAGDVLIPRSPDLHVRIPRACRACRAQEDVFVCFPRWLDGSVPAWPKYRWSLVGFVTSTDLGPPTTPERGSFTSPKHTCPCLGSRIHFRYFG